VPGMVVEVEPGVVRVSAPPTPAWVPPRVPERVAVD